MMCAARFARGAPHSLHVLAKLVGTTLDESNTVFNAVKHTKNVVNTMVNIGKHNN